MEERFRSIQCVSGLLHRENSEAEKFNRWTSRGNGSCMRICCKSIKFEAQRDRWQKVRLYHFASSHSGTPKFTYIRSHVEDKQNMSGGGGSLGTECSPQGEWLHIPSK